MSCERQATTLLFPGLALVFVRRDLKNIRGLTETSSSGALLQGHPKTDPRFMETARCCLSHQLRSLQKALGSNGNCPAMAFAAFVTALRALRGRGDVSKRHLALHQISGSYFHQF